MKIATTELNVRWQGSFDGSGIIQAPDFEAKTSLPKDFSGLGEGATPEDLILAALSSCYIITLGIILDKASIENKLAIAGTLETEIGSPPKITRAILKPRVAVQDPRSFPMEHLDTAKKMCLVSRAVAGNIAMVIEPEIIVIDKDTSSI